jgi:hypothetical protein
LFNIFKRDKPVDDKDKQPAPESDPQPGAANPEETTAPLNPAEPSGEESPTPEIVDTSAPSETGSLNPSEEVVAPTSVAAEGESDQQAADSSTSSPDVNEAPVKVQIPDISAAVASSAPRKKSLVYHLFSPETRLGRVMRPVLRWLAAITGLFALGLLAGYILLYQPTQRELDTALAKLSTTNQLVSQKEQGLASAQSGLDQAQLSIKQVQDKLDAAASENMLLIVMVDVSNARVALVGKDGATAKTAIQQAQSSLSQALPYIESQDKVLSDLLTSRLDLIAKELVSDPQAAQSDLGKLASDLSTLHQKIFGG